jgi:hypothetical protein
MRFRARIVPLVLAGVPVVGCDDTDSSKAVAKTDTPGKTEKGDTKVETKAETKTETKQDPKPPIVIQKPEDIPVALGGAPMPYDPPPPPPPKAPSAPAPAAAPSASAPVSGSAAAAAPASPTAIALMHDHPPGEACKPLTREEVEKALADLKN